MTSMQQTLRTDITPRTACKSRGACLELCNGDSAMSRASIIRYSRCIDRTE